MSKNSTEARLTYVAILMMPAHFACAEHLVLVAGGTGPVTVTAPPEAQLHGQHGVDFDRHGNVFLVEMPGNRVRRLSRGDLTVIAGTGEKGLNDKPVLATNALLNGPHSIAVTRGSDVYIADTWNNCVRT